MLAEFFLYFLLGVVAWLHVPFLLGWREEPKEYRAGEKLPFGHVLGFGPSDVPAYSSDYNTATLSWWYAPVVFLRKVAPPLWMCVMRLTRWKLWKKHFAHNGVVDGRPVFFGARWQWCVSACVRACVCCSSLRL
jgi:hypothetical protein